MKRIIDIVLRTGVFFVHRPVWTAIFLTMLLTTWIASGMIRDAGRNPDLASPIAEREYLSQIFKVTVRPVYNVPYQRRLVLQARTEADRRVTIAAETAGVIAEIPVEQGRRVKKGDVICEIETSARDASLAEARANERARKIEFEAAQKLLKKGHTSMSQVAGAQAAYDAAHARAKSRRIELERTKIQAPFDGIIDQIPVEVGNFIGIGAPCAVILDKDPIIVVAFVSESEVASIALGAVGEAKLVTGQTIIGHIRYVAEVPDPVTRTFRLEVELDNRTLTLRDGISAEVSIITNQVEATQIPQGIMILNADGKIGVRTVNDKNNVVFRPIQIVADVIDGAWVQGLTDGETVITVGQSFVITGQRVAPIFESVAYTTPAADKSIGNLESGIDNSKLNKTDANEKN